MVEPLKSIGRTCAAWSGILFSCLWIAPVVIAQGLTDPTRPPASIRSGQEGDHQPANSGPVLQSVLISEGRKVAIISGQTVRLGEKFGGAKVVKITESAVTLSGANGVQTLKLFPGVEKDMASNRKHPQADSRRQ